MERTKGLRQRPLCGQADFHLSTTHYWEKVSKSEPWYFLTKPHHWLTASLEDI
jgi:hypothetical protein